MPCDKITVTEVNDTATDVGKQITLGSGALLTLNADGSYTYDPNDKFDSLAVGKTATDSFTYTITDTAGDEDIAKVTITISGANEAPNVGNSTFSVPENSPAGTPVGNVMATDPDAGTTLTYALSDSGGAFEIDQAGQITVLDGSKLDFETKASYSLEVSVSDGEGGSDTGTITINLSNVNDPPTVAAPIADMSIPEDSAQKVIDISGVFADQDKDTLTFTVTSSDPAVKAELAGTQT